MWAARRRVCAECASAGTGLEERLGLGIQMGIGTPYIAVGNELVANAVALQNVVDQAQALHALRAEGTPIDPAALAFLSPYVTSHLKRFGDYATDLKPDPLPGIKALPI